MSDLYSAHATGQNIDWEVHNATFDQLVEALASQGFDTVFVWREREK
jgi:hypothetical protein